MALYKQTRESVTVYVKADSISSKTEKKTADEGQDEKETTQEDSKTRSSKRMQKMALHVVRASTNFAMYTAPNFAVGQIGKMYGDSNYQQRAQRVLEIYQDVGKSVVTPALTGVGAAAIGLGPVGIGVSVATAVLGSAMSTANKYEQRNINNAVQVAKENANANYNKARSGIDITDGRTRLR